MKGRILVVDDEKLIRWSLRERLAQDGYTVVEAADGATAREMIRDTELDLVLLDLRLPDADGIALLKEALACKPELPIIIMTAYSSVESAVEAMRCGAINYLSKPFNMDEMSLAVRNAIETAALRQRVSSQVSEEKARFGLANIVGKHPLMEEVKNLIARVAQSETTSVLLLGESGTGKDMVARAIHYESHRVDSPFVNITCTALPEALLESELFGYEKGAFTDAKQQKKGLFEVADGGTVFLDEIGEIGGALQAKLLHVLEDRSFKRVGGTSEIGVDVRVVAATNRDLDEAIRQGRFREDLYYRLSTLPIVLPPLRERPEDIPLLAEHFLSMFNVDFHRHFDGFSAAAMDRILAYSWPGNVRELRNVAERAVLLATGPEIGGEDIILGRASFRGGRGASERVATLPEGGCNLADVEKDLIEQSLQRTRGNQTQAANLLGLSRDQIRYKMGKYGIES